MQLSSALNNSIGTSIRDSLNGSGVDNVSCEFRSGLCPASPDEAATGSLMATGVGQIAAFSWNGTAIVFAGLVAPAIVSTPGTMKWVRFKDDQGVPSMDIEIATSGDQVMIVNSPAVDAGGVVSITALSMALPLT